MMTALKYRFLFLFILWFYVQAHGQTEPQKDVYLKIQPEIFNPIILIVPPFESESPDPLIPEIQQIMRQNLQFSGFFEIIPVNTPTFDLTTSSLFLQPNRIMAQVNGKVKISRNQLSCAMVVKELPTNRLIFEKEYRVNLSQHRPLARKISDDIVFYLMGEEGIANSKIAFTVEDGKSKELAKIDYDGFDFEILTGDRTLHLSPAWLRDGNGLIFMSYLSKFPSLHLLTLNSRKIDLLALPAGMYSAPAISPDGSQLAFTHSQNGNSEIYSSNVKGLLARRLTNHPAIDSSPSWSPTGRQIAFTSDRSGSPQIYLMDSEGGNIRRLTFAGNYNDSPDWSPRGDLIAFVSRQPGGFQIYVIDINGENLRQVTDSNGSNEDPGWSPDGLQIAYASNRGGSWNIYVTNLTNLTTRQVTFRGGCHSPGWSPRFPYKLN